MAAISSGVARPGLSLITETRYCILDHLLWLGTPLVGGRSSLLRTPLPRSDAASRISFKTSATPVENDPTRRSHRWTPAPAVGAAGGFRSVAPHLDLPIAGLRPLGGELERHAEVGGLDDPEVGEVLLVSNVGASWPYAGTGRSSGASPPSRASVGCILRAPRRPIDLDRYALREGSRFDQVKCHVRAGVGEQPRALTDDHGADEQGDLVDQLVVEEPADQVAAAVYLQIASRLGFQLADGRREVTGADGRVRPLRIGERVRCDVLGPCVQGIRDGAAARIHYSPVAGEELVGAPAEQERVGALVHLVDERHGLAVEQWPGPSAALESGVEVRMPPPVSLHHAVDGDLRGGRQFHDRGSLLLWGRPSWAAAHPCHEHLCLDPTPPPGRLFEDFLLRRLCATQQRD